MIFLKPFIINLFKDCNISTLVISDFFEKAIYIYRERVSVREEGTREEEGVKATIRVEGGC